MSDFEGFDPQLADALRRRADAGNSSVISAHEAVLARAGRIRRRRSAGAGGLALVGLVVGGFALLPGGGDQTLVPGDTGEVPAPINPAPASTVFDTSTDVAPDPATDTSSRSTTSPAVPGGVTPPGTAGGVGATATTLVAAPATTSAPSPTSTPSTPAQNGAPSTSVGSDTTVAGNSTSTVPGLPSIQPFTKTYPSVGGSITVDWNGSALSLRAVTPAAGFQSEIEDDQPQRIRVRFRGDDGDSRIEVRISDGKLIESIS